jgi:hypothetical protein|tara:strand:- start:15 stop:449 length:435 start_codon:yes stop_codon:yes gene_type:complete
MIYISHRGFVDGKNSELENNPAQIEYLINKNIDVEIDVRFYKNKFYLGHDEPIYEISENFLHNKRLWCHAKNYQTLEALTKVNCHYFWHQEDDYTLTSKGFIWVYPGKTLIKNSICVLPEEFKLDTSECYGVCTDHISRYIEIK